MKIGLYTLHASNNVGAMLQTFALTKILQREGAEVEIVNVYTQETEQRNHHCSKGSFIHNFARRLFRILHPGIAKMEKEFDVFHEKLPLSKRYFSSEEYIKAPNKYDIHLVGSDQVWNLQKGYDCSRLYFLDYLPQNSKKISYASSFGTTEIVHDVDMVKQALIDFAKLSTREDSAVEFLKNSMGLQCEQVVDPSLLLTSNEWDKYIDDKPIVSGKYIFFYGVNREEKIWNMLCAAKKKIGAKIVGFPGLLPAQYRFDEYIYNGGPLQFINLIKYAQVVVTSSFHGLAFAVNYNKPFVLVKFGERMERMNSLARLLDAEDRIANSEIEICEILAKSMDGDFQTKLQLSRERSLTWVRNNIING